MMGRAGHSAFKGYFSSVKMQEEFRSTRFAVFRLRVGSTDQYHTIHPLQNRNECTSLNETICRWVIIWSLSMLRAFILSSLWWQGLVYFLGGVMSKDERKQLMKIAAMYDIHGNLPALEAALSEIEQEGVDVIVVGGDIVPGPMAREVLEVLLNLGDRVSWIRGIVNVMLSRLSMEAHLVI